MHPRACRRELRLVEEEVRPWPAERDHPLQRRPKRRRVRATRPVAADDDGVVVAMEEGPLRFRDPLARVQPEALERAGGMPHLDHRGRPAMRRDVDGQVGVVDDEQPGSLEVVHPPHQPGEVGDLAGQPVAVRLEQQDDIQVGPARTESPMDVQQVAVQLGHPRGGQHDPLGMGREPRHDEPNEKEERAVPVGIRAGSSAGQARVRTMMFCPSSVTSLSRMSWAMTSATWLGCMIEDGSSSGASLRRSSVAVRPGEML